MARTLRVIDEGPAGEILLVVNQAYYITEDEDNGLLLTEFPSAITLDDEGRIFYTAPHDATFYGRINSLARHGVHGA